MGARPTRAAALSRLLLAHGLSLPLAIGWAIAAIPPIIHLSWQELLRIDDMEAVGQYLVRRTAIPAGVALLLPHLLVIPWMIGRDERRGRRFFIVALALLYVACAVVGVAGWVWLHVRS